MKPAVSFGLADFSIGPSNSVFESFEGEREIEENPIFDYGKSGGKAAAYVIGYHYDYSISFAGMIRDVVDYVKERW